MKLAIENFSRIQANKKVLMLGAMAELGNESIAEHEAIISLLQKNKWDAVVLVGGDFKKLKHPFLQFENSVAAKEWLQQQHFEIPFPDQRVEKHADGKSNCISQGPSILVEH